MKKSYFAYALIFISILTQITAIAQPTLPSGSTAFQNFHTLTGSGTINGVSYTWTSQSRNNTPQSYGCSTPGLDPQPWLDAGMTTTITFNSPVSNIGFVVWGMDTGPDQLSVEKNGAYYPLSASELKDNRVCADNTQQPGAVIVSGGNLLAQTANFFGYTVVQLNTNGITTLLFTNSAASSSGFGFAGIFATAAVIPATPVASVTQNPTSPGTSTGIISLTASTGTYAPNTPVSVTYTKPGGGTGTYTGTTDGTGKINIPNLPAGTYGPFTVTVNGGTPSSPGGSATLVDPAPACAANAGTITRQ